MEEDKRIARHAAAATTRLIMWKFSLRTRVARRTVLFGRKSTLFACPAGSGAALALIVDIRDRNPLLRGTAPLFNAIFRTSKLGIRVAMQQIGVSRV
nr:hypothetical protein [Rhizobium sp. ACO-34A]